MLKAEFIKGLKQNNVSKNAEKTMERLSAIWKPLPGSKRDEILSLVGLKKSAIERAYTKGNVSAKIVVAVSQVLGVDPNYITGASDDERPFDDALVVEFLKESGYDVGKGDVARKKRVTRKEKVPQINPTTEDGSENNDVAKNAAPTEPTQNPSTKPADTAGNFTDLPAILAGLSKIFGGNVQGRVEDITEEEISFMLKSLSTQARFSDEKKNRLALIKCLLLL